MRKLSRLPVFSFWDYPVHFVMVLCWIALLSAAFLAIGLCLDLASFFGGDDSDDDFYFPN